MKKILLFLFVFLFSFSLVSAEFPSNLREGLIAWWSFDNETASDTLLKDDVQNVYNGVRQNMDSTNWVAGKLGGALHFDGSDEWVNISNNNATLKPLQNMTFGCWAKLDTAGGGAWRVMAQQNMPTTNNAFAWGFENDPGNAFDWRVYSVDGSGSALTLDDYEFIVGKYNGTHTSIWLNGVQEDQNARSGNIDYAPGERTMSIGGWFSIITSSALEFWQGDLDECFYYDRDLSPTEILQIYNSDVGITYEPDVPSDTCTYSGSGNWIVDAADNCVITSGINLLGNDFTINGIGSFSTTADIINFGIGRIFGKVKVSCNGGCFRV